MVQVRLGKTEIVVEKNYKDYCEILAGKEF